MEDGDKQRERDRQLLEDEPFEGFPNRWADPQFQKWLFGYDAFEEVDKAWPRRESSSCKPYVVDIANGPCNKDALT